jgi:lysophospholipase L1-like esterase
LGDSFTEGAGGSRNGGYVIPAGNAAGLDARPSGVGATGIVADHGGLGGRKAFRDRLSTDVIPFDPEVVVIAGGLNDAPLIEDGSLTLAQYRAEYDALIADIKTGLPDAKIVVLGPFSPGSPTNRPSLIDIRDVNRAAAQAAGVPFIDVFYFDDEDKSSYINADGVHPNDAGYEYLGEKLGADLVEALR